MSNRKSARSAKTRSSSKARSKTRRKGPHKAAHSKQARVLGLLRSSTGATITGIMRSTGWQSHSVRGFLTAVVRKKLGLKLASEKADGERVYRIIGGNNSAESTAAPSA